jgi:preprotein translocase subunit SecA
MLVFTFKGSNNNTIEITAPSKTAAKGMVKRICPDDTTFRYESHRKETEEEWFARRNRQMQRAADAQAEQRRLPKIVGKRKAFSRNDRCPCGSGKKVKHCWCTRKQQRTTHGSKA